ncbi:MAG: alpha amylase [Clostridiales bacterium]|nr:alpha amylase [Clostridiales bacterium]
MENLLAILDKLKSRKRGFKRDYYIPRDWNVLGYNKFKTAKNAENEIIVNPYDFMIYTIEQGILSNANKKKRYDKALDVNAKNSVNVFESTVYSMLPRMFTAWDHYKSGEVLQGSFVKSLCLLPYLKQYNIDIIYLLPVFEYSNQYKRGEIGSPYSIKNIYKLDENLHEELLGQDKEMLGVEFKAFVEACHIMGIRVMVDFVFRTVARDNDLIVEHPDWFYWIDLKYKDTFSIFKIPSLDQKVDVSEKTVHDLYKTPDLKNYLKQFRMCPKDEDPYKWEQLIERHNNTGENILDLIESYFHLTTAPAFSDTLNDIQPAWSDVTYIKFFRDRNEVSKKYVSDDVPPYILQDGAKLSVFPAKDKIKELWEYVLDVIPFYQNEYMIDGARIDMGHALPRDLNEKLVALAKKNNKNFILWSEEFDPKKSKQAKDAGFHFISGSLWSVYKEVQDAGFNRALLLDSLMSSELPVAAAVDTPDTPRAATIHYDKTELELIVFLNSFVPNSVPFITNGSECMEIQPMNMGLGNTPSGQYVLPKKDPMYGKLAFFDKYSIHWGTSQAKWMSEIMKKTAELRKKYMSILSKKENFIVQEEMQKHYDFIFFAYYDKKKSKGLFFLANRKMDHWIEVNIGEILPVDLKQKKISLIYAGGNLCNVRYNQSINKGLMPGEVILGVIE